MSVVLIAKPDGMNPNATLLGRCVL